MKPKRIGLLLASNPLVTLAWSGEKLLDSMDKDPSLSIVLDFMTLY